MWIQFPLLSYIQKLIFYHRGLFENVKNAQTSFPQPVKRLPKIKCNVLNLFEFNVFNCKAFFQRENLEMAMYLLKVTVFQYRTKTDISMSLDVAVKRIMKSPYTESRPRSMW